MITGIQIRMARTGLHLGVRELAALAGVAPMTISRLENSPSSGYAETIRKIQSALEEAGVTFLDSNEDGPGVRIRILSD